MYRYPVEEAAPIALRTVAAYLTTHPELVLVRFVLFDPATYAAYHRALAQWQLHDAHSQPYSGDVSSLSLPCLAPMLH